MPESPIVSEIPIVSGSPTAVLESAAAVLELAAAVLDAMANGVLMVLYIGQENSENSSGTFTLFPNPVLLFPNYAQLLFVPIIPTIMPA